MAEQSHSPAQKIRVDKWLWQARFFKTRSLASKIVSGGHLRINGQRSVKPAHSVGPGDVLTFPQARLVRVVRILAIGARRGPAAEAQALYEDLTEAPQDRPKNPKYEGKGRPSKRDRRNLNLKNDGALE